MNGRRGIKGKVAADGELGYTVNERPRGPGMVHWVSCGQVAGLLRCDDAIEKDTEGIFAD